ncbi:MAG: MotA/TolQ/ExbB proton channel family protein, partial [Paracoccus sp. (in: a-proteobacteria)]
MEPIQAAQALDFSLLALFARASLTVKVVMVLLIVASVWSWAIIIQKFLAFAAARREQIRFDRAFWSGEPLDDVYDRLGETPSGATERVFAAGMTEWRRSHRDDGALIPGGTQRIDRAMNVAIQREETRLFRGLSFLATVGSTAPFIGLFGTVWGIMNSFQAISITKTT